MSEISEVETKKSSAGAEESSVENVEQYVCGESPRSHRRRIVFVSLQFLPSSRELAESSRRRWRGQTAINCILLGHKSPDSSYESKEFYKKWKRYLLGHCHRERFPHFNPSTLAVRINRFNARQHSRPKKCRIPHIQYKTVNSNELNCRQFIIVSSVPVAATGTEEERGYLLLITVFF